MEQRSQNRAYSLDLLRILCMLMIVSLHFMSHGGMLGFFGKNEIPHYIFAFIRALCICSVNVFVLISGYFMINKKSINLRRVFSIALAILFYSWLYFVLNAIIRFEELDFKGIMTSIFPISYKLYWFPTCYLFILAISPFLNKLLTGLSVKAYRLLLAIMFVLFSVANEIIALSDPFSVVNGHSIVWFVFLYCLAGYIRLHGINFKMQNRKWLLLYFAAAALIFVVDTCLSLLSTRFSIIERYDLVYHFSRYCSALVTLESVALFMYFKNLDVKSPILIKCTGVIAPLTFGVYLIHDNALIRNILYYSILRLDKIPHNILAVPIVICLIILVFATASLIELLRQTVIKCLGRWGRYEKLVENLQNKLDSILNDYK